jgi:superfamily II DNA/RNA helicase
MDAFEKLGIDEDFNPYFKEEGFTAPTEVQKKVIPKLMENTSVICVAQTGTGKTLAYALPISEMVKTLEDEEGLTQKKSKPYAIIVAPTKELALQIQQVFKDISHHVKLRVRTVVGGAKGKQTANLASQSYEILIATPTRLAKGIKNKEISTEQLKYLVFDEADNLFELGFRKDIETTLFPVNYADTDIHFFSATMPKEVEDFLNEKFAKKKLLKMQLNSAHRVQQKIETFNIFVTPKEKPLMLKMFLEKTATGRGIVFINQKNQVKEVEAFLQKNMPKLRYKVLHGDLEQKERIANFKAFVDKKAQILVATDIAARGIDVKDVAWVLNFGLPRTPIYYLHRCGRTGRAGNAGAVYNFVTHFDANLIRIINESIQKQDSIDIGLIAKDISEVPRKKVAKKKVKTKRVKITKRSKR